MRDAPLHQIPCYCSIVESCGQTVEGLEGLAVVREDVQIHRRLEQATQAVRTKIQTKSLLEAL